MARELGSVVVDLAEVLARLGILHDVLVMAAARAIDTGDELRIRKAVEAVRDCDVRIEHLKRVLNHARRANPLHVT